MLRPRLRPSRAWRVLLAFVLVALIDVLASRPALAGPPTNTTKPNPSSTEDDGFKLPDFVYGGNALSLLAPVQVGIVGYAPRGRIGLQYDRQIYRPHWVHIGVAGLFDRGGWKDFRMTQCGLANIDGKCDAGTVAGADVWLGYTYKLYIEKKPFLVPYFRAGLAGGFWKLPDIYREREQSRELSWVLGLQAGMGLRVFLFREFAIGLDVEFRPSVMVHKERGENEVLDRDTKFSLPIQILPLIVEWRF